MTTVKTLHVLLYNFADFCSLPVRSGADDIQLRLFLPPADFYSLMKDFEQSVVVYKKPVLGIDQDGDFETIYRYQNIILAMYEGNTFKIELSQGSQIMENELSDPDPALFGMSPNIDYKPKFV